MFIYFNISKIPVDLKIYEESVTIAKFRGKFFGHVYLMIWGRTRNFYL